MLFGHNVKNSVSATGGHMQVFRAVKSRFYVMNSKRKPSVTLGEIIKILVIAKLTIAILRLLLE
jgi:hypothetical protein